MVPSTPLANLKPIIELQAIRAGLLSEGARRRYVELTPPESLVCNDHEKETLELLEFLDTLDVSEEDKRARRHVLIEEERLAATKKAEEGRRGRGEGDGEGGRTGLHHPARPGPLDESQSTAPTSAQATPARSVSQPNPYEHHTCLTDLYIYCFGWHRLDGAE